MATAKSKPIRVGVYGNVKLPDLYAAIVRAAHMANCVDGGAQEIDFSIFGGDLPVKTKFKAIPGITKSKAG